MDKLTAMRSFVAVVQNGSFSAAAASLGTPKTRISQRVQELEAALSTRLLYRTTRVISLTEEGRLYFDKCIQIIEEIEATEQALGSLGEQPQGRLRVSCMGLVARQILLPAIPAFFARYPRISINLSVTDRLINLTEEGYDCAIRGGNLESSSLICRHIRDVGFGLYAAPGWLRQKRPLRSPDDLANLDLIKLIGQRDGMIRHWELIGPDGLRMEESRARLEVDDDQAALEAALAGSGLALCPDFAAAPHIPGGRLARVLPEWSGPVRPVYAVYPARRHPSAKLRAFMDWAESVIRTA